MRLLPPALIPLSAPPIHANTLTFLNNNYIDPTTGEALSVFVDDGIIATASPVRAFWMGGHLDGGGTLNPRWVEFTMGERFDATSFKIRPLDFEGYVDFYPLEYPWSHDPAYWPTVSIDYENVLVQGYRAGEIVASSAFNMLDYPTGTYSTHSLSGFSNLDMLTIGFSRIPDASYYFDTLTSFPPSTYEALFHTGSPASHYTINNVTLTPAPIPLPASSALLISSLVLLGYSGRRKTQQA